MKKTDFFMKGKLNIGFLSTFPGDDYAFFLCCRCRLLRIVPGKLKRHRTPGLLRHVPDVGCRTRSCQHFNRSLNTKTAYEDRKMHNE